VTSCGGRSPGSRVIAVDHLPRSTQAPSGNEVAGSPLTVAGAAAALCSSARTAFPFDPLAGNHRRSSCRVATAASMSATGCDAKDCHAVIDRPQSSTTDGSSPAATVATTCCLNRCEERASCRRTSMCRGLPEKMFLIFKGPPPSALDDISPRYPTKAAQRGERDQSSSGVCSSISI
jgi:hypothetical protein